MPILVLLLASFISLPIFANVTFEKAEVKLVQQILKEKEESITFNQTHSRLLENTFLLEQAKQRNPAILVRQSAVGFSSNFHARRYTLTLLKSQFPLPHIPKLNDKVWQPYSSQWLQTQLPSYPSNNVYTELELMRLAKVDLSHLADGKLTLATLMSEQSMQNRYKLHQGDIELFKSLVAEHRRFNLIMKGLNNKLQAQHLSPNKLINIAKAELLRPTMLTYFGVAHSLHAERSDYLDELQQRITEQAVHGYFAKNKQKFRFIEKVQANAVLFEDKAKAEQFQSYALAHSFDQAVTHFKQVDLFAVDKGLVKRQKNSSWAQQVVFSLQPNQLSKPIRSPQGQWLVAHTKQRFYAYYDKDSETVKYQAKLALTDALAKKAYAELKKHWFEQHNIKL
ncbi:peptidyl-prolyl cis-trans isomerase [Pseudoalteromonas sp. JBTF-M23]|uniref:Peptidyl-prolyl cis-trans isomerase n=1 Tax=Pseudoalteromonas caenipelagi TaxID=2726988 RepID=A0A849VIF6_9GAMM|nr:peptidylprolyl isomerase [Pseudoalteromonas caenipelagi]NOU52458.1 peptidyl-prolyl cis-trans isomerase [Pseudoalteromonas caenipelagi]